MQRELEKQDYKKKEYIHTGYFNEKSVISKHYPTKELMRILKLIR